MKDHIDAFLDHLKARGYAQTTLENYNRAFRPFLAWLRTRGIEKPEQITSGHLSEYQEYLYHEYSPGKTLTLSYQMNLLKILKPLFRYLCEQGRVLSDPSVKLSLPKLPRRLPRDILSKREIRLILKNPDIKTLSGFRDRLIFELLYATGIRKSELFHLSTQDINIKRREIMIRLGKGAKDRVVPIPKKTAELLEKYLYSVRPELINETKTHALIINDRGGPYNRGNMDYLMKRTLSALKLKKHITTHSFRHTCATHLLKNRADIRVIQELLGHKTLASTQQYTRVDITDLRRMIDKHHPREQMKEGR